MVSWIRYIWVSRTSTVRGGGTVLAPKLHVYAVLLITEESMNLLSATLDAVIS